MIRIGENENIIQLIFNSFEVVIRSTIFEDLKNKQLSHVLYRLFDYEKIYQSLGKRKVILEGHNQWIQCLSSLNDGNIASVSVDKTIKVWNISKYYCTLTLQNENTIDTIVALPNGNIISCSENGNLEIWDSNFKIIQNIDLNMKLGFLLLLPSNCLACTTYDNNWKILILDCDNGYKCIKYLNEHSAYVISLVNLSRNKFASGSRDKTIRIWDALDDYKCVKILVGHDNVVSALLFVDKDNLLISGSFDKTIKLWSISDYQCLKTIKAHNFGIKCLVLLPGGYVASSSQVRDNTIKLWNLKNLECVNVIEGKEFSLTTCLLLKDKRIVCATLEGKIIIFGYGLI
jgi:WD40 repeat protein